MKRSSRRVGAEWEPEWPGRLQRMTRGELAERAPSGAELWLDGGHNEDGGRALGQAMADLEDKASRPLIVICGTLATKDTGGFLKPFAGLARLVIGVPVEGGHQGRAAADVAAIAGAQGLSAQAAESVEAAFALIRGRAWERPPRILVAGSLHLAGAVLATNGVPPA